MSAENFRGEQYNLHQTAMSEAYLAEVSSDSEVRRCALSATVILRIGRDSRNAIVIDDRGVSRYHAMLECGPTGEFCLSDLGSRNGTLLNGRPITAPMVLHSGDRIRVGQCEFVFQAPSAGTGQGAAQRTETESVVSEQLITVLIADIRGFTALSRNLGEAKLAKVISAFNRECGAVIASQHAWGQKFIGDAVMGIWVHAALEPSVHDLLRIFTSLNRTFEITASLMEQFQLEAPVRIGAGINTGKASLANVGSGISSDFTAVSDAVNLSFRLESATCALGCDFALGEATYEALCHSIPAPLPFTFHQVVLKGYDEPVPVFAAARSELSGLIDSLRTTAFASSPGSPE